MWMHSNAVWKRKIDTLINRYTWVNTDLLTLFLLLRANRSYLQQWLKLPSSVEKGNCTLVSYLYSLLQVQLPAETSVGTRKQNKSISVYDLHVNAVIVPVPKRVCVNTYDAKCGLVYISQSVLTLLFYICTVRWWIADLFLKIPHSILCLATTSLTLMRHIAVEARERAMCIGVFSHKDTQTHLQADTLNHHET